MPTAKFARLRAKPASVIFNIASLNHPTPVAPYTRSALSGLQLAVANIGFTRDLKIHRIRNEA